LIGGSLVKIIDRDSEEVVLEWIAVEIVGSSSAALNLRRDRSRAIKTIPTQGEQPALERLFMLRGSIWPKDDQVHCIALGAPGALNPVTGITYTIPNIPNWNGLHLVEKVQDKFNVEVRLGNDANLAALGEWKYGAGVGHHDLVYLTVSTGLGGGITIHDRCVGSNGCG
jgi:glucokinase